MHGKTLDDAAAAMKAKMVEQRNEQRRANLQTGDRYIAQSSVAELLPEGIRQTRWDKDRLDRAMGPLVYIALGRNDSVLYVGMSSKGLFRALSSNHHVLESLYERLSAMEFISCSTIAEAAALEKKLIALFQPVCNIAGLANTRKPGFTYWVRPRNLKSLPR